MKPYYGPTDGITIYHGDCLEVLPALDTVADAVVTDPPYFLPAAHYNTRKSFARSLSDLGMLEHFYRDVFKACSSRLSESGVWYVFCDGQSYPVFYALLYGYCRRIAPLVWDKQVSINGYSWRHQHELIVFGEMPKSPAIPTGDGDILRCRAVPVDDRDHPAAKPVELIGKLVTKSTSRDAVVLDPFCGGGSTLLSAAQFGRRAIGIERDERYCEIAAKRLSQGVLPLEMGA